MEFLKVWPNSKWTRFGPHYPSRILILLIEMNDDSDNESEL